MPLNNSQQHVWDALTDPYYGSIQNNESLLVHIARSQRSGIATEQLGNYFVELTNKVIHARSFLKYDFQDDMIQYSVMMLLTSYKYFDETKSNNPCAYLYTRCYSACVQYINKERKQIALKQDLRERVKHGQAQID